MTEHREVVAQMVKTLERVIHHGESLAESPCYRPKWRGRPAKTSPTQS